VSGLHSVGLIIHDRDGPQGVNGNELLDGTDPSESNESDLKEK
jgi:hypothetical protein